jgi:hypothetical protein
MNWLNFSFSAWWGLSGRCAPKEDYSSLLSEIKPWINAQGGG